MKLHHPILLVAAWILSSQIIAQNSELDDLRIRNSSVSKNAYSSALCVAFAKYSMTDSAMHCANQMQSHSLVSAEAKALIYLAQAKVFAVLSEEDSASMYYDKALEIASSGEFGSMEISSQVYLDALEFYSYFVLCEQGLIVAEQFVEVAENSGNDSLLMTALLYRVQMLECVDESEKSRFALYAKAKEIALRNEHLIGFYNLQLGLIHYYFNRLPTSIEKLLLAEHAIQAHANDASLTNLYISFANVYEELNDFEKAKQYLYKAKPLIDKKFTWESADFYNTLGWIHYRMGEPDSALKHIRTSLQYYTRNCPGNPEIAYATGNLGLIYRALGHADSALFYSNRAIGQFEVLKYYNGIAEAKSNIGFIKLSTGNDAEAKKYFEHALAIGKEEDDDLEKMNALFGLSAALEQSDPKKALAYYKQYSDLRLILKSNEEALKAQRLETKVKQDRQIERIELLELNNRMASIELDRNNMRLTFISISLFITIAVAVLIFYHWLQRKTLTQTLQESVEINQRIISMISHDFRGPLNNVKLSLELLQSNDLSKAEFDMLVKDLYRQSSDVALMFDSFVGWAIAQRGGYVPVKNTINWIDALEEAINISTPLANLKNVAISLEQGPPVEAVTDHMAISLILRNILSNAIKYSHHGGKVDVKYYVDADFIYTTICDYGVGMVQDKLEKILTTGDGSLPGTNNEYGAGLGLRMVVNYVKSLRGRITASTSESGGSAFTVVIPRRYAD